MKHGLDLEGTFIEASVTCTILYDEFVDYIVVELIFQTEQVLDVDWIWW